MSVLLSLDENGNIQAVLPYLLRERVWMKYIVMPQQTQIGGIWICEKAKEDNGKVAEICQDFVNQLESLRLTACNVTGDGAIALIVDKLMGPGKNN